MSDVIQSIKDWLTTEGYPLEMVTTEALRAAHFNVAQSEYYTDPETEKSRELDVYAWAYSASKYSHLPQVSFAIECKTSRDKPWLLFWSKSWKLADTAYLGHRSATPIGRKLLRSVTEAGTYDRAPFLKPPQKYGHSIVQALRGNREDLAYNSVSSVCNAVVASEAELSTKRSICGIVFPVVLLDGQLFTCTIADNGEIEVEEAESGVLIWRNPILGTVFSIIHVYTRRALDQMVQDMSQTCRYLLSDCHEILSSLSFDMGAG